MALPKQFSIVPNPHWVVIDNFSKLPIGAAIFTYRSLDPSQFKQAFMDPGGQVPYPQPIVGNANGTFEPIFWEFDPNNPNETYYIQVWSSNDINTRQFLWDFDGLSGASGGGGGGNVTSFLDIRNLVVNNIFYRNIGDIAGTPSLPTSITIAPSNNAGYVNDPANINVTGNGPVGPDIIFAKGSSTSSDSLKFTDFLPIGSNALSNQITPKLFVNYTCTVAPGGDLYKYIQIPLEQNVSTLSAQNVTVRIYARCNSGNTTLVLTMRQFFGSGGAPSPDVITPITPNLTLTTNFVEYVRTFLIPSVSGKSLGTCGNDAVFLQINFPLNALTNIDFIKPSVYLGNVLQPGVDFVSNDEVNGIVNSPRTGDVRISLNSFLFGWVIMNDGTIGDSASNATTRANVDTFPLFSLIWNLFVGTPTLAPMFTSGGVPLVNYGSDPVSDFTANRQISLTKAAGRVMAAISGVAPIHNIGEFNTTGDTHTLVPTELPNPLTASAFTFNVNVGAIPAIGSSGVSNGGVISNGGGNTPFDIRQPTVYMNFLIKL